MGADSSKPDTKKITEEGETADLAYAMASMRGWRQQMEDTHICQPNIAPDVHLFAVFDGHGGPEVARFCQLRFHEELAANENFRNGDYKKALEETFLRMDELMTQPDGKVLLRSLKRNPQSTAPSQAGSAAVVCLLAPN